VLLLLLAKKKETKETAMTSQFRRRRHAMIWLVTLFILLTLLNIAAGGMASSMLEQVLANPVPAALLIVSMWLGAILFVLTVGYAAWFDQFVAYKLRTGN
jgi:hypothetical protein